MEGNTSEVDPRCLLGRREGYDPRQHEGYGLHRLRKICFELKSRVRARLQSCRKLNEMNEGFTGCGKTLFWRDKCQGTT
jgi:hypothetical protein